MDEGVECCDCREFIPKHGPYRMMFADPPFNFGQEYEVWDDRMSEDDYESFTEQWLRLAAEHVVGSLWVNVPDERVSFVDTFCRELGWKRVNWIIWHYRFGQHTEYRFVRSKSHLLWFVNDTVEFTPERVTSVRQEMGDLRAGDGRVPGDVWGFEQFWGRVQGNNKERVTGSPNQLPELLVARAIGCCTKEGDKIIDPFCGSGTTLAVGRAMNRKVYSCDVSKRRIQEAVSRISTRITATK